MCTKARSVEILLQAAVYSCSIPKSRLKHVQHNRQSISNNIYPSASPMEISRNPSKCLPMMLLFIHRHYVLNYPIFYEQWAPSPSVAKCRGSWVVGRCRGSAVVGKSRG